MALRCERRRRHVDNLSIEVFKLRGEDLIGGRNKEGISRCPQANISANVGSKEL
ncbi:unnamed protein product, partial [Sphenostylis stenocarpa]